MKTCKLIAKTLKAKNKLKEAKADSGWIVVETRDNVAFSDKEGPWHYVRPSGQDYFHARWVNQHDDRDFDIYFY